MNPSFLVVGASLVISFAPLLAQIGSSSDSPWEGREVFREKGCIHCHAVFGEGGKGGPDLGEKRCFGTYLELTASLWNHFPKMSKRMQEMGFRFPRLERKEMEQLISFLSFIRYMGEPGSEFWGRKLLRTMGCVLCHKFGGLGGGIGPDISARKEYISPLRLVESMWNHGPEMMELFREHNIERPVFNEDEIVDLAAGIQSFMSPTRVPAGSFDLGDPLAGEKVVEEKGCMHCHSFRGVGGTLGPDFSGIYLDCSVTQLAGSMWNHGSKMWEIMENEGISFPIFERGEMADVIAYLFGLRMKDSPGDAAGGCQLIQEKGCLSCHSLRGKGAGIAGDLAKLEKMDSPMAMVAAMWNHATEMEQKHLEKRLEWPEISGEEVANLYACLRDLSASQ